MCRGNSSANPPTHGQPRVATKTVRFSPLHSWNLTPRQAVELQHQLAQRVERHDRLGAVQRVAGVDAGFEDGGRITRAAVAVLSFPGLQLVDSAVACLPTSFPYVPGLLSFREVPAVLAALERLSVSPDLILCDGQGIAHPRRFGIASHLGILVDIPTVGVAKSRLTGVFGSVPEGRGSWVPLMDGKEIVGAVLRTRPRVKPLFVSVGHRICLDTAVQWVIACVTRFRLPETTRWAHRLASNPQARATRLT